MNGEDEEERIKQEDERLKKAVSIAVWNRDAGKGIYEKNSRARKSFIEQTTKQIQKQGKESGVNISASDAEERVNEIVGYLEQLELARQ